MKNCLNKLAFACLIIFALGSTAPAAVVTLTSPDPGGTSSLNSAGKWDNLQAPASTNDYFTSVHFVRTPTTAGVTFAGHSLTLQEPAGQGAPMRSLLYKGPGGDTIVIDNLTNAAGAVLNNGGSGNVAAPNFTGNLWTIAGNSTILSDQGSTIIGYPIVGSAILTNTSGQTRTITYNGSLAGFTGKFHINSTCTVGFTATSGNLGNPGVFTPDQIMIGAGCVLLDNGNLTFNNANSGITLLGPGNATINAAGNTTISQPISDLTNGVSSVSSLTKNGGGSLTLSGVNNYSGATIITAGALIVGSATAIPVVNVTDNGVLNLNGNSITINGLTGSGVVDTVGGTPTLTVGVNGGGGTLTGSIQNSLGTLSLVKFGAGTLNLNGGYSYSGQTLAAGGTLSLVTAGLVPSPAGDVVVSNGATLNVDATSGFSLPGANLTVAANSTLNVTLPTGTIAVAPTGNLTLRDNATNVFNYGSILANPTSLALNAAGSISAPGTNIVIKLTGLGFQLGTFSLIKYTGTTLANVANFSLDVPSGVTGLLLNNPGNHSIDVQITSIPNQLVWNGVNGTSWDLTTANWTNLAGGITVFSQYTNGSIIAGDSALFDDTLTNDFTNPQPTNINLTGNFSVFPLIVNSTLPYSISGAGSIRGTTSLVKSNTGSLTLNTSNSYTGGTLVFGGTLAIANDSALGATNTLLTLNGGNLQFNGNSTNNVRPVSMPVATSIGVSAGATARIGGVISGAGALSKTDNGTLTFGGNEIFSGNLFVKSGTLIIDQGGTLTNTSGAIWFSIGQNVNDTGTLTLRGNGSLFTGFDFNVGDIDNSAGVVNIQDTATLTANNLFVASGNSAGSTASGTVNQTGGTVNELNAGVGFFTIGGRNQTTSIAAVGTYNISGGTLNAAAGIRVGGGGVGTINQNGGTINARGGLNIARLTGSVGTNNLNGGVLSTLNVASSTGVNSVFNFNGGTMQANFTPGNPWMGGLSQANILAGGAFIDSSNNNVTITQPLLAGSANGGVTKLGTGSLTLSGVNTFTGPITNRAGTLFLNSASTYPGAVSVNGGTLQMTTASIIQGGTIVTNGATLSMIQLGSATGALGNLTLNGGATGPGATLGLTPTGANNPAVALLNCGTLTLNGTNTVSLAAAPIGTIALIKYVGALGGSGNITNLSLPQGATGFVSNNAPNSTLYAVITSAGPGLTWTGTNGVSPNLWDINNTTNWLVNTTPTSYRQIITPGDAVTFNDAGSGTVTLNTNVSPASVVFSNITKTYTVNGSGRISGSTGLLKLGTNTAILNITNNTYLGDTTVSNGTLQVANNGTSSALSGTARLVIGPSGTLRLSSQLANAVTTVGELTGAGQISYTGGNNSILQFGGAVGGTWNGTISDAGGGGLTLTKTGSGTWIVGGTNRLNNGDFFNAVSQVQFNNGTTILTNNAFLESAFNELWIAQGANSTSTVIVAGATLAVSNNWLVVARGDNTANGTLIVNSGQVVKAGNNNLIVGSTGGQGTLIVNGGQVRNNGPLLLGENAGANGVLRLNGGLIQATQVRPNGAAPASSIAYFNGGTLQATANNADFITLGTTPYIQSGGGTIDDGGFAISMSTQIFQEDPLSTGGGLIKKGTGTLYLDAVNTYLGTTVVSNGTLAGIGGVMSPVLVAPAGNIAVGDAVSPVTAFTVNNTLTIQGKATMRVDKTGGTPISDQITSITTANYGGLLVVSNATSDATPLTLGDTFTLFAATTHNGAFGGIVGTPGPGLAYSFANGVLSVVVGPATNPTNITATVVGGTLKLSWPADHLGWTLQTNAVGLDVTNAWFPYPGSASQTNVNITLNPSKTNVFFRLVYP